MGTSLYGIVLPESPFEEPTTASFRMARQLTADDPDGRTHRVTEVRRQGLTLNYSEGRRLWFWYTPDLLIEPPSDKVRQLAEFGFEVTHVELESAFGVIGPDDAYQGIYRDEPAFPGCAGLVDNRVDKQRNGPRQETTVYGPLGTYAKFYIAIRQHDIKPQIWLEPKPRWTGIFGRRRAQQ